MLPTNPKQSFLNGDIFESALLFHSVNLNEQKYFLQCSIWLSSGDTKMALGLHQRSQVHQGVGLKDIIPNTYFLFGIFYLILFNVECIGLDILRGTLFHLLKISSLVGLSNVKSCIGVGPVKSKVSQTITKQSSLAINPRHVFFIRNPILFLIAIYTLYFFSGYTC